MKLRDLTVDELRKGHRKKLEDEKILRKIRVQELIESLTSKEIGREIKRRNVAFPPDSE